MTLHEHRLIGFGLRERTEPAPAGAENVTGAMKSFLDKEYKDEPSLKVRAVVRSYMEEKNKQILANAVDLRDGLKEDIRALETNVGTQQNLLAEAERVTSPAYLLALAKEVASPAAKTFLEEYLKTQEARRKAGPVVKQALLSGTALADRNIVVTENALRITAKGTTHEVIVNPKTGGAWEYSIDGSAPANTANLNDLVAQLRDALGLPGTIDHQAKANEAFAALPAAIETALRGRTTGDLKAECKTVGNSMNIQLAGTTFTVVKTETPPYLTMRTPGSVVSGTEDIVNTIIEQAKVYQTQADAIRTERAKQSADALSTQIGTLLEPLQKHLTQYPEMRITNPVIDAEKGTVTCELSNTNTGVKMPCILAAQFNVTLGRWQLGTVTVGDERYRAEVVGNAINPSIEAVVNRMFSLRSVNTERVNDRNEKLLAQQRALLIQDVSLQLATDLQKQFPQSDLSFAIDANGLVVTDKRDNGSVTRHFHVLTRYNPDTERVEVQAIQDTSGTAFQIPCVAHVTEGKTTKVEGKGKAKKTIETRTATVTFDQDVVAQIATRLKTTMDRGLQRDRADRRAELNKVEVQMRRTMGQQIVSELNRRHAGDNVKFEQKPDGRIRVHDDFGQLDSEFELDFGVVDRKWELTRITHYDAGKAPVAIQASGQQYENPATITYAVDRIASSLNLQQKFQESERTKFLERLSPNLRAVMEQVPLDGRPVRLDTRDILGQAYRPVYDAPKMMTLAWTADGITMGCPEFSDTPRYTLDTKTLAWKPGPGNTTFLRAYDKYMQVLGTNNWVYFRSEPNEDGMGWGPERQFMASGGQLYRRPATYPPSPNSQRFDKQSSRWS